MSALAEFQARFVYALRGGDSVAAWGPGLAVHQNTLATGLIDVLRANYPAVLQLTGADWFNAAAHAFACANAPTEPALALYGAGFADWLAARLEVHQLPYLEAVAQLDRAWTEVHFAPAVPALEVRRLQSLSPAELGELTLQLIPAARLQCVPQAAATIWERSRQVDPAADELCITPRDEAILLARPQGQVEVLWLSDAERYFLTRLIAGEALAEAASRTLQLHPDSAVSQMLAKWLHAQVLCAPAFFPPESSI